MGGVGFWKWELERRLAVLRWDREDAEMAAAQARIEAARGPTLERRRRQLAWREAEAARMRAGSISPDQLAERTARISDEDAEWQAFTASWEGEDQVRHLRREQAEGRRCAEIQRWLDENAWELISLDMELPAHRRLLQ